MGVECLRGGCLKVVAQGLADDRQHGMYYLVENYTCG